MTSNNYIGTISFKCFYLTTLIKSKQFKKHLYIHADSTIEIRKCIIVDDEKLLPPFLLNNACNKLQRNVKTKACQKNCCTSHAEINRQKAEAFRVRFV